MQYIQRVLVCYHGIDGIVIWTVLSTLLLSPLHHHAEDDDSNTPCYGRMYDTTIYSRYAILRRI